MNHPMCGTDYKSFAWRSYDSEGQELALVLSVWKSCPALLVQKGLGTAQTLVLTHHLHHLDTSPRHPVVLESAAVDE